MSKPSAARAILVGGLIAGALDITYACVFFGLRNHVSPIRILQSVARGALGQNAFQGGLKTAALGLFFHFLGHIFGPLIVWILKRADAAEIDAHGKESLNFQLSMLIYDAVAVILCFVLIGIPILIVLWVLNTILVIFASIKASEGQLYRYPLTIRLIK